MSESKTQVAKKLLAIVIIVAAIVWAGVSFAMNEPILADESYIVGQDALQDEFGENVTLDGYNTKTNPPTIFGTTPDGTKVLMNMPEKMARLMDINATGYNVGNEMEESQE